MTVDKTVEEDGAGAGREMVVLRGQDGAPQARQVKANGWTAERVRCFLEHLSATCNVRFAARMAGMSESGAYGKRRDDPAFRAAWREAIDSGYVRLEAMLIARAGGTHDTAALLAAAAGDTSGTSASASDFDASAHGEISEALDSQLAMSLMASHRKVSQTGGKHGNGGKPTAADPDVLADAILKQLSVLNRRRGGRG